MRLQIVFHRGQQPGRFITRRLDHPAIEWREGWRHVCIPDMLIAGLRQLFQKNKVALRVHRDETQTAGERFVLGHGEVSWGHVLGLHRMVSLMQQQALAFGLDLKDMQLEDVEPERDLV